MPAAMQPARSSLLGALRGALAAMGDTRDAADIAGLSGLAFRLQVDARVSPASVPVFPWAAELPSMLGRLGYATTLFHADDADPRFDALRAAACARARASAHPSILFGVHLAEFGLVIGAVNEDLLVSGVLDGRGAPDRLACARVGAGELPVLCLLTIDAPTAAPDATRAALRYALRAALGDAPRFGGFSAGPAAYAAWREALERGTVDPAGHAIAAQALAEARALAPVFLARAANELPAAAPHLRDAAACYRRAADALVELAAGWPFPIPEGTALTAPDCRAHAALLADAAAAEGRAADALARALDADRRATTQAAITVARGDAPFACVADLPLADLDAEARTLARPEAFLALEESTCVGHVYFAALAEAGAAVTVGTRNAYLYVYCMWVAQARRGAGIGRRLLDALVTEARARCVDGLLVEATSQAVFLDGAAYEALGFHEVDRLDDDQRLLYMPVGAPTTDARLEPPAPVARAGHLPVVVAVGRPCPLLLRSWRNIAAAACATAGVALEERDHPPHGVEVGGRRLPLLYLPQDAAAHALADAADVWAADPR